MSADRRLCPIKGCPHMIEAGFLMCRPHWRCVSDVTRRAVNNSWREFLKASRRLRARNPSADEEAQARAFGRARSAYEQARAQALGQAARDPGEEMIHE